MRRLLEIPCLYALFAGFVIGNGRFGDIYIRQHLRVRTGDKILDIGCGPGSILEGLPTGIHYTGFDISAAYIDSARRHFGDRGTFFQGGVEKSLIGSFPGCDLVLATGVLHHLSNDLAETLIDVAWSNLRPGGRLVTSDPCFTREQPWLNRRLVGLDRGQFVREASRYEILARTRFQQVGLSVYHDLLRIPYSHAIMECTRDED